jgi:hypothetical protein
MGTVRVAHDDRTAIWLMADDFLVECPKCRSCALVVRRDPSDSKLFAPRRLICGQCGLTREWAGNYIAGGSSRGDPTDPVFHLPLWLQAPCCGQTLWAYNTRHLRFIKEYVGAALRQRRRDPQFGWSNRSLASRLPRLMVLGKNRDEVLKTIEKLENSLEVLHRQHDLNRIHARRAK